MSEHGGKNHLVAGVGAVVVITLLFGWLFAKLADEQIWQALILLLPLFGWGVFVVLRYGAAED
ncbi:MAG: hypothetical protein R2737_17310 [Candidatus Nanopelagicales bacterium]